MVQIALKLVCGQLWLYIGPFRAMATHFVSIFVIRQRFLRHPSKFPLKYRRNMNTCRPKKMRNTIWRRSIRFSRRDLCSETCFGQKCWAENRPKVRCITFPYVLIGNTAFSLGYLLIGMAKIRKNPKNFNSI